MWRPRRRFCQHPAVTAQVSPSVPQEVKYSRSGGQSRAPATVMRHWSSRRFMARPAAYWALGFANWSVNTSYMASATARGTGVVAA